MKKTKLALFQSVVSLLLCISMLAGTTFAWFTDSVTSGNNIIKSGRLDVTMEWFDGTKPVPAVDSDEWIDASTGAIFNYSLWEPGYTQVRHIKIANEGNLALKYQLHIQANGEVSSLADVIDVYFLDPAEQISERSGLTEDKKVGTLTQVLAGMPGNASGSLLADETDTVTIALKMQETAGNEYQNLSIGSDFKVILLATQEAYESDSFGTDYDKEAAFDFPANNISVNVSGDVAVENGAVKEGTTLNGGSASAVIPAGVQMAEGNSKLTLTISEMAMSGANLTLSENEAMRPLNVHVEGIAANNTIPMEIYIKEAAAKGLNAGNLKLYHVENGSSMEMTAVDAFTAHNQFKYDPATGDIILYMATFSEVALVADTENAWKGKFDYTWYDASKTELTIANADQLAAFGAIVGGMKKVNDRNEDGTYTYSKEVIQNSFAGKTVKLISDVNLGDNEEDNKESIIFYPIGYYNSTGSYEKTSGGSVTSSVSSFEGTFDGNGHTIANFYQNTWEMFGDYNDGYSGTPNHYKDAMGLFGYVLNGTVKNLTVSNFSSDGEYTPTGVIAAYSDGNSSFENIAITNCNPRVYNTGNGGIIGIAGDTSTANDDHITLKNITVDNSNKISALWGSWDVACGGLVGMYRGNVDGSGNATGDTISFENCHVSAIIDVYNDVCANYQYYAYRYSGMIIGSVRHNTTNAEGKTIPNMTGISATGCTVNYGDWNDYYYCEFEKNTMASYSEDYQFSRVPHSELNFTDSNGNGVIDADERASVTGCKHTHTAEENHQAIYLPFHQLFTGYSWGVSSIGLEKYSGVVTNLDITEGEDDKSDVKFTDLGVTEVPNQKAIKASELFGINEETEIAIKSESFHMGITNLDENGNVTAEFVRDDKNWENSTITLTGTGRIQITVQDYYFCTPTTIEIEVTDRQAEEKFESKFTGDFLYRVGNQNTVSVGSLFAAKDGATINSSGVVVTIDKVDENSNVGGTFTANTSDWTQGTIKFSGTGVVKVTITDNDYCTPTELNLEVVNAVNATTATSATKNNVVLLNDVGLNTIEVSNGYTLYGNGFKMTATTDPMYDTMRAGFVTLDNGTLDNVQVICPNFSFAIIYNNQIKDAANTAKPSDGNNDARGNVRSAVMVTGNSKIVNSYVHGGRAAIFLRSGNLLVDGSTISGGAAANIHALSAQSLTLRDVTLIQKPFTDNVHNTGNTLMGFSGLFECGEDGYSTPLILEGTLIQNAWINESYVKYAPSAASSIVENALEKTAYLHDLDGDGKKESLNLGFTFIPQEANGTTKADVTDNRTNMSDIPYGAVDVGTAFASAKVYSYQNTQGTSDDFNEDFNEEEYKPDQGATAPTVTFTDTNADRVFETKFDANDGRWESTLTVNLDNGNYTFSFDKLLVQKHGENLSYTVKTVAGTEVDTSKAIALTASGMTEYVLTVTDGDATHTVYFILTATKKTIPEPVKVADPNGTHYLVVKSKNSDWSCAINALDGAQIEYYDANGQKQTLDLSSLVTSSDKGKLNDTNNTWTKTQNGYTLKITCGVIHDTKSVYGMPVAVNGKLYFTISSTNGYVSTSTAARSVTLTYEFTDPNGKTLKFTKNTNFQYADYKNGTQYSYSDFVNGTLKEAGSSSPCVTPDTLITIADGTQKRIDQVTYTDRLLAWDFFKGELTAVSPAIIFDHGIDNNTVIELKFSDGTTVKAVNLHQFFDADLNQFVSIDADSVADYVGHMFAKKSGNGYKTVKLVDYSVSQQLVEAWGIISSEHYNIFVEGMFSTDFMREDYDLFNYFEVGNNMTFDAKKMQSDIEKYGLYTYADFAEHLTFEQFKAFNVPYFKIAVGKGNYTYEGILALIEQYLSN